MFSSIFSASEPVQRMFQLGFNRRRKTTEFYASELIDTVKRHDLDTGSMESKRNVVDTIIFGIGIQTDILTYL